MIFQDRIHPQLRAWYDASAGFDFDHLETFVPQCNAAELANLKEDPAVSARDVMVPGPKNAPDVKVRIYTPNPRPSEPLPCLFFYHGGGYLFGSVYRQEALCQRYVKQVGCVVISVEYRLAVSGLSAGGGLAAGVALMARDLKGPALCLQMPLYAELDYRLDSPSSQEITDPKVWCRDNCEKSWAKVLSPGHMPTAYESPALAKDLTGLPPLFSYIGQLDPGRDENIRYWSRMMGAGVDVEYHVFPGCYHCFELSVPDAEPSKAAYEMMYAALRRAFGLE